MVAIAAIVLFAVNLVIGTEANGSKNWINLGPISIQPSEFIKIAFIFVGASTLDKLQTAKNLWGFLGFTAVCLGALMLMKDFGTACIFFNYIYYHCIHALRQYPYHIIDCIRFRARCIPDFTV